MAVFDEIYEKYGQRLYRFLLSLTGDEHQAEEMMQETFYQAFLHIEKLGASHLLPGKADDFTGGRKMKINCEVMQDLLPLYADEVCTPSTSKLVKEHLDECEACKNILANMKKNVTNDVIEMGEDTALSEAVKTGVKKAKRKDKVTACIATIVTICLLVLGVNEFFGWGVCFTNIDNIIIAHQFMSCLKNGDYEKAAEMQEENFKKAYKENKEAMEEAMQDEDWEKRKPFFEEVIGVSQKEYVEARKQEFVSHMKLYEEHINLKSFCINSIHKKTNIEFAIEEEYLETNDVFPCYLSVSVYSRNFIECITGGIKSEETKRENYEAYDRYDLFSAINDSGTYYEGSVWWED